MNINTNINVLIKDLNNTIQLNKYINDKVYVLKHDIEGKKPRGRPNRGYRTFKQKYQDPEYKRKHLEYISTKIKCECGIETVRCNIAKHRRTYIHKRIMENKLDTNPTMRYEQYEKIKELESKLLCIKQLQTQITSLKHDFHL